MFYEHMPLFCCRTEFLTWFIFLLISLSGLLFFIFAYIFNDTAVTLL